MWHGVKKSFYDYTEEFDGLSRDQIRHLQTIANHPQSSYGSLYDSDLIVYRCGLYWITSKGRNWLEVYESKSVS
jgi:hypothetical protein